LDLANGGLMILAQILMHVTISNKLVQSKMYNKLFGKFFDRNTKKMINSVLKNTEKFKNTPTSEIDGVVDKANETILGIFGSLTSLIAATTIGKRIIVPFIATPLAGKVEERMNKNKKVLKVNDETQNNYNPDKHSKKLEKTPLTENNQAEPENSQGHKRIGLLDKFKK